LWKKVKIIMEVMESQWEGASSSPKTDVDEIKESRFVEPRQTKNPTPPIPYFTV
jgi:hypothetical protein